jgi:hypothetical protein
MKKNIVIGIALSILSIGCASKSNYESAGPDEAPAKLVDQVSKVTPTDLYSDGKTKLIKTANYRFETEDVKKSTDAIIQAVKRYPSYISSSSLHLEDPILENKMTIRVQNEFFQDLLQEIDLQAKFVNYRDVTTNDVSKDFVDLESRLKTKREVETRYMDILRKKAGTIEELLNAEREIGQLHEDIEATISRINYLREQVSYSTINLEFYQTVKLAASIEQPPVANDFLEALSAGWSGIMVIALALTYLWPLVIVGLAVLISIRIKRQKKAHVLSGQ